MPMHGSPILIVLVALIGGAALNLAVAWSCVWWQKPIVRKGQVESQRVSDAGKALWTEVFGESIFLDRFDGGRDLDPSAVPTSPVYGAMTFWVLENRWYSPGMERWWIFDMSRSVAPGVRVVRAGLPMHSFGCRLVTEPANKAPPRTVWERGGFTARRGNRVVELPWMPLWPGFAVNTLVFSLPVAAVWLAAHSLHRVRRRRRGLCVECAYPVGVSAICTECGNASA